MPNPSFLIFCGWDLKLVLCSCRPTIRTFTYKGMRNLCFSILHSKNPIKEIPATKLADGEKEDVKLKQRALNTYILM